MLGMLESVLNMTVYFFLRHRGQGDCPNDVWTWERCVVHLCP